ncbi:MAG: flagellin-like protein [Oscillospiraceae bacterium]|nr:flagellin-like protein [Oscillospiraceae bacterium]
MLNMLDMYLLPLKLKVKKFFTNEDGDTNIVSMVVLIGIAVLLAIVFKDAIAELIQDLLDAIKGNATDAATKKVN